MNTSRRAKHKMMFILTSIFSINQYMLLDNGKILDFFGANFCKSWECLDIDIVAALNY